jgi:hypothetical protein
VQEDGCTSAVVGRQIVSFSAHVLGRDAMTSKNTPPGAEDLGMWGDLGVWTVFGCLFGTSVGTVVGLFVDNIALGLAFGVSLGLLLGVVVGSVFIARKNDHGES